MLQPVSTKPTWSNVMTRLLRLSAIIGLSLVTLTGCLVPSGDTPEEKRAAIQRMKTDTLNYLYQGRPTASDVIGKAPGYAVFSNINALYLFGGGGGGYGVAVDQARGRETYMQMAQVGVGLGLGVQDIRVVIVFHSQRALDNFITSGWEFGAQADAAAKAREKGLAATGEVSIDSETTIYTLSEAGLMAKVNLVGTKYWRDNQLN
jgi:lipid-binding SYLF domain-containing protein